MGKKQHTPEQIIFKLREADVALGQGKTVQDDLPPVYVPGPMLVTARSEGPLLFLEGLFLPEGGRPLAQVAGSPMRCAA